MKKWYRWQDYATVAAGLFTAIAVLWTRQQNMSTTFMLLFGGLLIISGIINLAMPGTPVVEYAQAVLAALLILSPWLGSYTGATGAAWTSWIAGAVALAVEPVAMPSSTMTTVRPVMSMGGCPWRNRATLLANNARSCRSTPCRSSPGTLATEMVRGSRTRTLPSPMAPMATSGWNGTPSFRTTITSIGASSALATSNATGTPPRGRPSTTTFRPRRPASRFPSRRPASDLS